MKHKRKQAIVMFDIPSPQEQFLEKAALDGIYKKLYQKTSYKVPIIFLLNSTIYGYLYF